MPTGMDSPVSLGDPGMDPILLLVIVAIFLVGAVAPIAHAVISSVREDRERRSTEITAAEVGAAGLDA